MGARKGDGEGILPGKKGTALNPSFEIFPPFVFKNLWSQNHFLILLMLAKLDPCHSECL